jgi:hypothetical protein
MEIQIPGEVPLDDHDRYVAAFLAGYGFMGLMDFTDPMRIRTIREDYPEAFDAGVNAAWKKKP